MTDYQREPTDIFSEPAPVAYGTFSDRLGAWIIDMLILLVPNYFINRMMGYDMLDGFYMRNGTIGYSTSHFNFVTTIVTWLYFSLQECGPAQATIGKRAVGLKVTDYDGGRITFGRATGRYFGKWISAILLLIGYLMILWDDYRQALHDKMAGTFIEKQ